MVFENYKCNHNCGASCLLARPLAESEGRLNKDFKVDVGKVAYHQPCHLKYRDIGAKSIELPGLAGAQAVFIDKGCSGHDGMWAMKMESKRNRDEQSRTFRNPRHRAI